MNGAWAYTYDNFNRLATATVNPGTGAAGELSCDRYGNRWTQTLVSGSLSAPQPQLTFTGGTNRVDQNQYDAAGNLTYNQFHHFTYDDEGRMVAVDSGATGTYVYDADGLRVHWVGSERPEDYVYDASGHAFETYSETLGTAERFELYAGGMHVATFGTTAAYFDTTDWTGTERLRSDGSGALVETCTSLPYGDNQDCNGSSDPSPRHFTGQMRDTETGFDYFKARYYASASGRFILPDWSAVPEPVPYADLSNPQTLNLYTYVGNNPITHTDVDGHLVNIAGQPGSPTMQNAAGAGYDGTPTPGDLNQQQRQYLQNLNAQLAQLTQVPTVQPAPPLPASIQVLGMSSSINGPAPAGFSLKSGTTIVANQYAEQVVDANGNSPQGSFKLSEQIQPIAGNSGIDVAQTIPVPMSDAAGYQFTDTIGFVNPSASGLLFNDQEQQFLVTLPNGISYPLSTSILQSSFMVNGNLVDAKPTVIVP